MDAVLAWLSAHPWQVVTGVGLFVVAICGSALTRWYGRVVRALMALGVMALAGFWLWWVVQDLDPGAIRGTVGGMFAALLAVVLLDDLVWGERGDHR